MAGLVEERGRYQEDQEEDGPEIIVYI